MISKTLVVFSVLIAQTLVMACHDTESVRFENRTNVVINVYDDPNDERPEFVLQPMERVSVGFLRKGYEGMIIAKTLDGTIVFEETITWDELVKRSTVIIE
jgi:hypothetical protein